VAAPYRGQGVGSRRVEHALEFCRRAQFAQVIVDTLHASSASRLYEQMGFRVAASFFDYVLRG
jgi:GNAT superfamily N-acetyltransferase